MDDSDPDRIRICKGVEKKKWAFRPFEDSVCHILNCVRLFGQCVLYFGPCVILCGQCVIFWKVCDILDSV